jgi:hypothetical protein
MFKFEKNIILFIKVLGSLKTLKSGQINIAKIKSYLKI